MLCAPVVEWNQNERYFEWRTPPRKNQVFFNFGSSLFRRYGLSVSGAVTANAAVQHICCSLHSSDIRLQLIHQQKYLNENIFICLFKWDRISYPFNGDASHMSCRLCIGNYFFIEKCALSLALWSDVQHVTEYTSAKSTIGKPKHNVIESAFHGDTIETQSIFHGTTIKMFRVSNVWWSVFTASIHKACVFLRSRVHACAW